MKTTTKRNFYPFIKHSLFGTGSNVLFYILSSLLLGCSNYLSPSKNSRYSYVTYVDPVLSISPSGDNFTFTTTAWNESSKLWKNSKLCICNLKNDSVTVLLKSDTCWYLNPVYSANGAGIYFTSYDKKEWEIDYYDFTSKKNNIVFHWPFFINDIAISPSNQTIYFIGRANVVFQKDTFKSGRSFCNTSLYSLSLQDLKLNKISTFYHPVNKLYIDKEGKNLYFSIFSDSVKGPAKLNLETNSLTPIDPSYELLCPNYSNLTKTEKEMVRSTSVFTSPIPSDSNGFIYLFNGRSILKYYQNKTIKDFYRISQEELNSREVLHWPAMFHNSGKILMLSDSTFPIKNAILLNENGQIEKRF